MQLTMCISIETLGQLSFEPHMHLPVTMTFFFQIITLLKSYLLISVSVYSTVPKKMYYMFVGSSFNVGCLGNKSRVVSSRLGNYRDMGLMSEKGGVSEGVGVQQRCVVTLELWYL